MKKKIIFLVLIFLAIGFVILFLAKDNITNIILNNSNSDQSSAPIVILPPQSVIAVTNSGFEPQSLTVKKGTQVVWTNESDDPVSVNSDYHPTHLLWDFLNLGGFENGSSVSVVIEETGTFTYHNHYNETQTGTVIVE